MRWSFNSREPNFDSRSVGPRPLDARSRICCDPQEVALDDLRYLIMNDSLRCLKGVWERRKEAGKGRAPCRLYAFGLEKYLMYYAVVKANIDRLFER